MKEEQVILVNEKDEPIGLMNKLEAHEKAVLHRAFSVFVFNSKGELMIQQRAASKYHSPTLWTNTCCSHPRDNETYEQAAHRRLEEEMGFDCELDYKFNFIYKAHLENDLIEHELDHVFIGTFDDEPKLNPDEVMAYRWVELDDLKKDMEKNPQNYTAWFKIIFEHYVSYIEE